MEEAVIPYCQEHKIGVVPFSPIASGLNDYMSVTGLFYGKKYLKKNNAYVKMTSI